MSRHQEDIELAASLSGPMRNSRLRNSFQRFATLAAVSVIFNTGFFAFLKSGAFITKEPFVEIASTGLLIAIVTGVALVLFGLLGMSAVYLGLFEKTRTSNDIDVLRSLSHIDSRLSSLELSTNGEPTRIDTRRIEEMVETYFEEKVVNTIEERFDTGIQEVLDSKYYSERSRNHEKLDNLLVIEKYARQIAEGMHEQIFRQQRNANFNVFCGVLFSASGLIAMGVFAFGLFRLPAEQVDLTQFAMQSAPKIAFVLIFESISFFFFRAYREDRSMVRYLRNETTNVEAKIIASMMALRFGRVEDVSSVVSFMMSTERNFILKKGEKAVISTLGGNNKFLIEEVVDRSFLGFMRQRAKSGDSSGG